MIQISFVVLADKINIFIEFLKINQYLKVDESLLNVNNTSYRFKIKLLFLSSCNL